MAVLYGVTALLLICAVFVTVQGQAPGVVTPVEQELRQNLTKLVRFVIDPSATPSMDLINFALAAGGSPRTQEERLVYLEMMKKIARATPAAVQKFTNNNVLDGTGLDAHITMRALQYVQKQREEEIARNSQSTSTKPVSAVINTNSNADTATTGVVSANSADINPPIVPAADTANVAPAQVNQYEANLAQQIDGLRKHALQELQKNNVVPANDGTISLEDMFRMINDYNQRSNTTG